MTNALHINALIEHCNKICDEGKCPYHFNSFNSYCELVDEFGEYPCEYGFAIASMKKQIPKKPIDICKTRMGAYTDSPIAITGRCPNCNIKQSFGSLSWHENFNKFCFKCGQPLDWSDENE